MVHESRPELARPSRRRHRCPKGQGGSAGLDRETATSDLPIARRFEDVGVAAIINTDIDRDGAVMGLNSTAL